MSPTIIYAVTTLENGRMYRYIFVYEAIEFWGEPEAQKALKKAFQDASSIPASSVVDIRESEYLNVYPIPLHANS